MSAPLTNVGPIPQKKKPSLRAASVSAGNPGSSKRAESWIVDVLEFNEAPNSACNFWRKSDPIWPKFSDVMPNPSAAELIVEARVVSVSLFAWVTLTPSFS